MDNSTCHFRDRLDGSAFGLGDYRDSEDPFSATGSGRENKFREPFGNSRTAISTVLWHCFRGCPKRILTGASDASPELLPPAESKAFSMNAILLTAFIGLVLATLFIVLFLYQLDSRRFSSNERESLMPLQDEKTRPNSAQKIDAKHHS